MTSPTPNKGYTYPTHGGAVNAWDTPLNADFDTIDLNVGGYYPITTTSTAIAAIFNSSFATVPSTAAVITVTSSFASNLFYSYNGTMTNNQQIQLPAAGGMYVINNNSSGAFSLTVGTPSSGSAPSVLQGGTNVITCDGTNMYLANTNAGFGPFLNLASSATTDLGTINTHAVNITGTTTITSFGASAIINNPLYNLYFSGVLLLTYNSTSLILPGSANITTAVGDSAQALYLGSGNWQITDYRRRTGVALNVNAGFLQNYLAGLILSTAGGSGTFGIAAGEAVDSTNVSAMILASAYTKTTASWVVGTGVGGLDTGAIANTTWYHVYVIQRPDTGVVDIIFSLSASSPTLPANYTLSRRIGAMKTDGSGHWLLFTQIGDDFIWSAVVVDANGATPPSVSRSAITLTVPLGVAVKAKYRAQFSAASGALLLFTSLLEADAAVGASNTSIGTGSSFAVNYGTFETWVNTSQQIGVRSNSSGTTYSIGTYGWTDTRGK